MITGYAKPFNESSLSKSEIFGFFKNTNPREKAIKLIKNARRLTNEDIQSAYIQLKQMNHALIREAVRKYDIGDILLLYNEIPDDGLSKAFPFMIMKTENRYKGYIFTDRYVSKNKNNDLNVNSSILYDLMVGTCVGIGIKSNYQSLVTNSTLEKLLMTIYTKFFMRILNKEYAISSDKIISESIAYMINRFFLEQIFESTNTTENINKLSLQDSKYLDEIRINDIRQMYDNNTPTKLGDLMTLIKPLSPRMSSLTLALFVNKWISTYYEPFLLALDNLEYFVFGILSVLRGTNLVSISSKEMVTETKGIMLLQPELIKLVQ